MAGRPGAFGLAFSLLLLLLLFYDFIDIVGDSSPSVVSATTTAITLTPMIIAD